MDLMDRSWGELSKKEQEILLKNCNCINAVNGKEVKFGECIVDFWNGLSVAGVVDIDGSINIDDKNIIYSATSL